MSGTTYDNNVNYALKVVPYNTAGEPTQTLCATATPTLPSRTVGVNDDPRHTTYDLGEMAGTPRGRLG